jgi:hypothetical protein
MYNTTKPLQDLHINPQRKHVWAHNTGCIQ